MPITVHTNTTSLQAQRHLNSTSKALQSSIEKLSSGFRINSAADDAAGLAISEQMKGDMRSLQQASRNANDAVSMIQTAESSMGDVHSILQRMRELAMQSASDGITDTQRGYIQTEVGELQSEIDRIVDVTKFNGTALLDGALDADFQVGLNTGEVLNVAVSQDFTALGLGVDSTTVDMSDKAGASAALALIDTAIGSVSSSRAELGARENRVGYVTSQLSSAFENLSAANARITETDVASEMAQLTKNQVLVQAGASMLSQANSAPQIALSLLGR